MSLLHGGQGGGEGGREEEGGQLGVVAGHVGEQEVGDEEDRGGADTVVASQEHAADTEGICLGIYHDCTADSTRLTIAVDSVVS